MDEDVIGKVGRCVARTLDLAEAEKIAEDYEMKGFTARIIKRKQGNIAMYEVWVEAKPKIFEGQI